MIPRLVFLWLSAALPGQTTMVVPQNLGSADGPGATASPFGLSTPARVMCVYNKEELGVFGVQALSSIALRADNDGQLQRRKGFVQTRLSMSTSPLTAETAGKTFDLNHGNDRAVVMRYRGITLPAQPSGANGPRSFDITMPFDRPFFFHYQLSPVRGRRVANSLVLDIQVKQQPAGFYRLDTPLGCRSTHTVYGRRDAGCTNSRGRPLRMNTPGPVLAGASVSYLITDANPNRSLFLVLGLVTPGFQPLRLTSNGCYLNTVPVLFFQAKANKNGIGGFKVDVPTTQSVVGATFEAQAGAEDRSANELSLITSQGIRSNVCGPNGVARISNDRDHQAKTGGKLYGSSFIFEMK